MNHRFRVFLSFLLLTVFAVGCQESFPTDSSVTSSDVVVERDGTTYSSVTDIVSVRGVDVCEILGLPTGCGASFSLSAQVHDDGSIRGQWHEVFPGGQDGIHVVIDCGNLVGNGAVLGGWVRSDEVIKQHVRVAVVDNGSSTDDPPDQLSLSVLGAFPQVCHVATPADFTLFDITSGQVMIR